MVKFKGRSTLKQYMPKKPIKRGYKVWAQCDAKTGYIYVFDIYIGKADENASSEEGLGYNVIMKLCEGVPRNTLVAFDNFFTGIPLMNDLLIKKGIYAVGTVRLNRKDLPEKLLPKNKNKNEKLGKHEFMYKSKAPVSAIQWMDTQPVNILTTAHNPKSVSTVMRTQKDGSKKGITIPTAIAEYTVNVGGVDHFDHFRASYPIGRKSKRNWLRLFYFIFDAAIINAYVLYIQIHKQKVHALRDYRLRLARSLIDGFTGKKRTTNIIFRNDALLCPTTQNAKGNLLDADFAARKILKNDQGSFAMSAKWAYVLHHALKASILPQKKEKLWTVAALLLVP